MQTSQPTVQNTTPLYGLPSAKPVNGLRFLAGLIDFIILAVLTFVAFFVAAMFDPTPAGSDVPVALWVVLCVLWFGYGLLFEGLYAATPGKLATGTRIVNKSGGPMSTGQLFGRAFGKILSTLVPLYIPYLMVLFTDRHQSLHDLMCGTLVYRKADLEAASPANVFG